MQESKTASEEEKWSSKTVLLVLLFGILLGGIGAGAGMVGSILYIEGAQYVHKD